VPEAVVRGTLGTIARRVPPAGRPARPDHGPSSINYRSTRRPPGGESALPPALGRPLAGSGRLGSRSGLGGRFSPNFVHGLSRWTTAAALSRSPRRGSEDVPGDPTPRSPGTRGIATRIVTRGWMESRRAAPFLARSRSCTGTDPASAQAIRRCAVLRRSGATIAAALTLALLALPPVQGPGQGGTHSSMTAAVGNSGPSWRRAAPEPWALDTHSHEVAGARAATRGTLARFRCCTHRDPPSTGDWLRCVYRFS